MKKSFLLAILAVSIFGFLMAKPAKAEAFWLRFWNGSNFDLDSWAERTNKIFENLAQILGISVEKVKNYWAEGKTIKEIMEAENIKEEDVQKRIQERELAQLKERLQKLVEKGIITQEQADKRYETMKKWIEEREPKLFLGKHWRKGKFWFWW